MAMLFAVMGNPIKHSLSPAVYQAFAKQFGHDIACEKIMVLEGEFETCIKKFTEEGGCGTGITVPLKKIAFEYAGDWSSEADKAQAASMLHIQKDGLVKAYNFDGIGLVNDLKHRCEFDFKGRAILVCGAGGAAEGALPALLNEGPAQLVLANRTLSKAKHIAEQYPLVTVSEYESLAQPFDLIINATSSSLRGESLPLPSVAVGSHALCYDMMYSNKLTTFLQWAKANGCDNVFDGLGMLVEHCACAYKVWFDVEPNTLTVIETLRD